jgi:hypothetical protein
MKVMCHDSRIVAHSKKYIIEIVVNSGVIRVRVISSVIGIVIVIVIIIHEI